MMLAHGTAIGANRASLWLFVYASVMPYPAIVVGVPVMFDHGTGPVMPPGASIGPVAMIGPLTVMPPGSVT